MRRIGDQGIAVRQTIGKGSPTQSLAILPHDGAVPGDLDDAVVVLITNQDIPVGK